MLSDLGSLFRVEKDVGLIPMVDDNHIGRSTRHCDFVDGIELEDALKLMSLREKNVDGCL